MAIDFKISIEDDRKKWDRILASLKGAQDLAVAWGIFVGEIAAYAMHNEYGAPNAGIKARPFLSTAVDDNAPKYFELMEKAYSAITLGSGLTLRDWLNQVGIEGRNDVVTSITEGNWHANAKSTERSKNSSRPLIDTGAMRNAIHWAIGRFQRLK